MAKTEEKSLDELYREVDEKITPEDKNTAVGIDGEKRVYFRSSESAIKQMIKLGLTAEQIKALDDTFKIVFQSPVSTDLPVVDRHKPE